MGISTEPGLLVSHSRPDFGVFESQVLEVGRLWGELGVQFRYLVFEGLRTAATSWRQIRRDRDALIKRFGVAIEVAYVPSPLSDLGLRWAAHNLVRHASRFEGRRVLIQGRGAVAACAALEARRRLPQIVVLYDSRADPAAEARLVAKHAKTPGEARHWVRRATRLEQLQRRAATRADHILAVSTPLQEHLCRLSGIDSEKVTVIPCCVTERHFVRTAETRTSMRRQHRLEGRTVFVYSGSLGTYQIPAKLADLALRLRKYVPQFHLLVLSKDRERAKSHFAALIAAGDCTVVSCLYEEVGDYLAAADIGLLVREDDPVNRVASPVKFAEYQVAGLPVVATPWIGDVGRYLESTGHGLLIDLKRDMEELAYDVSDWITTAELPSREAIQRRALSSFARSNHLAAYHEVLSRIGFAPRNVLLDRTSRGEAVSAT